MPNDPHGPLDTLGCYAVVPLSENSKIGIMAATYAPMITCPAACKLRDDCYAMQGTMKLHTTRFNCNAEALLARLVTKLQRGRKK